MQTSAILRNVLGLMMVTVICTEGVRAQVYRQLPAPRADHHTHLRSPEDVEFMAQLRKSHGQEVSPEESQVLTAAELITALDAAGVQKAAVLSTAYFFGMTRQQPDRQRDAYGRVKTENDWVALQVAGFPRRLVGFCGVNPHEDYVVREIRRCKTIGLRGLKLHFGNSDVDLRNPKDLAQLKTVFAAANEARFAVLVHLRTNSKNYGARDARAFIEQVLPAAPDVPVQIAHMAGWGGYDRATDEALGAFIEAMRQGRLRRSRIYFDISGVVLPRSAYEAQPGRVRMCFGEELRLLAEQQRGFPDWATHLVQRIRQLGLEHVLFATDWPIVSPASYQALVREQLDLNTKELWRLFAGAAPYLR